MKEYLYACLIENNDTCYRHFNTIKLTRDDDYPETVAFMDAVQKAVYMSDENEHIIYVNLLQVDVITSRCYHNDPEQSKDYCVNNGYVDTDSAKTALNSVYGSLASETHQPETDPHSSSNPSPLPAD